LIEWWLWNDVQVKLVAQDGSAQRMDLHVGLIALLKTVVCNVWICMSI
jgi:hypothetical protein